MSKQTCQTDAALLGATRQATPEDLTSYRADKSEARQRQVQYIEIYWALKVTALCSLLRGPTWKSSLSMTVSELLCRVSLVRLDMSLNNPAGKLSR